jgi:lysozyme
MATSKIIAPCFEIQTMSEKGIAFLINEEGLRLKPYLDSAGIPTIGIGCTIYENGTRVTMKDKAISKSRAISLFRNILKNYERAVWSNTRDDINQNQFDALTSLCYNIGVTHFKGSTVLRLVNAKAEQGIKKAFEMWRFANGEEVLLERRRREADLYFL